MKNMTSNEIRNMWLDFFRKKGHDVVPGASLIPVNDPTLLWINSGVAPLKRFFDGREIPKNRRMVNSQKSIRTNDIENVGKTGRHHTFFEMLGNFSIGDYFRDEALSWAVELLSAPEWFGFNIQKLYFSVYPEDHDTIRKWISLGVSPDHIIKLENNFWEIGEGPCGPNTEIFYDRGEAFDPNCAGIKLLENDTENDRYIEIWNIVFSQYNAEAGRTRGDYKTLPSKNIDTGMGLERVASIMQNAETNYETDLFLPIIKKIEELTGISYAGQTAFRVIADHLRSVVFAIADGAAFGNEGRGYVLRRLLRRAVRFGKKLGMNCCFLHKIVLTVADIMMEFYPYVADKAAFISMIIKQEEEKFLQTLETGENRLLEYIKTSDSTLIPGDEAFLLYDTFGFPLELTVEVAREHGCSVDIPGFNDELSKQKERARRARAANQSMMGQNKAMMDFKGESVFVGYEALTVKTKVLALFKDGKSVRTGTGTVLAVFRETPFYAEAGGQISDKGTLAFQEKQYNVVATTKMPNFQHGSLIELGSDSLKVGSEVALAVDPCFRAAIMRNHTATHLLNESLRRIVGAHVFQQGSFVGNAYLRFDFNNYKALTEDEILATEDLVNEKIKEAIPVSVYETTYPEAIKQGVQAVFGEKYGDIVRVVSSGFSRELCGGTHVLNTADIKGFAITSVESKGSGIYRIEAATGDNIKNALAGVVGNYDEEISDLERKAQKILADAGGEGISLPYKTYTPGPYKPGYRLVLNRLKELDNLRNNVKELDKAVQKAKKEKNTIPVHDYLKNVLTIGPHNVLIISTESMEISEQKDLADRLADHLASAVVFIANVIEDKIVYVCKNNIPGLHAGNLVRAAAKASGGAGGGRSDFAQGGGRQPGKLPEALQLIEGLIKDTI